MANYKLLDSKSFYYDSGSEGVNNIDTDVYSVYFLPGNPAIIDYYETFLQHLSGGLSASTGKKIRFIIHGSSYAGFELENTPAIDREQRQTIKPPPYSLQEQIEIIENRLHAFVCRQKDTLPKRDGEEEKPMKVILIGHSVGAYILLELLRRYRSLSTAYRELEIVGGILLFPAVTHLDLSPSGQRFGGIFKIPNIEIFLSFIVHLWTVFLPLSALVYLFECAKYFRKPGRSVSGDAALTTARFLKSPNGVKQALYLARFELLEIKEDKWDEDIWGAASPELGKGRPKLFFYFGENDHWVANHTRDDLIAIRAAQGDKEPEASKPKMMIDETGSPHAFCTTTKYSIIISEKVQNFVEEIVSAYENR